MWADRTVHPLSVLKFPVQRGDVRRARSHLIRLPGMRSLRTLDHTVQLRRALRQREQSQATFLASLLEVRRELAAAVDMYSALGARLHTLRKNSQDPALRQPPKRSVRFQWPPPQQDLSRMINVLKRQAPQFRQQFLSSRVPEVGLLIVSPCVLASLALSVAAFGQVLPEYLYMTA
jgi:hypothetical protein